MPTETPIPTEMFTPTVTPTPTETATATLNYYIEMQTPGGAPARVDMTVGLDGYVIALLLFAILFSMWLFFILGLRERRK